MAEFSLKALKQRLFTQSEGDNLFKVGLKLLHEPLQILNLEFHRTKLSFREIHRQIEYQNITALVSVEDSNQAALLLSNDTFVYLFCYEQKI